MKKQRRDKIEAAIDKSYAVEKADEAGLIADSADVRKELMRKVHAGEISLVDAQAELARIKRGAKKAGLKTRTQVWKES